MLLLAFSNVIYLPCFLIYHIELDQKCSNTDACNQNMDASENALDIKMACHR